MTKRLIESLQEAVAYAKGNKAKGYETKISVYEPVEIPEAIDVSSLRKRLHMSQDLNWSSIINR